MKLLYFAWIREKIGIQGEEIELTDDIQTVSDLIDFLEQKGPEYKLAFENKKLIQVAIDHNHVKHSQLLAGASEVAFFPPMTGG